MGNLTKSKAGNVWSPNGNSLATFVNTSDNQLYFKDAVGNVQPLSDFVSNPVVETPNLTQVLAIDNKTNNIPIVSNNGNAILEIKDAYSKITYTDTSILLDGADVRIDSPESVSIASPSTNITSNVTVDINTPILNYNGEEVATQPYADAKVANDLTASTTVAPSKTAVLTEYDMITGLTFSGAFALDKKGGRSYLPYTQTGSLTLSIAGSPIVGGFAVLRFTADGSAISGYSGWKLLSSDAITATNGVVHRVIVYQYEDEIWYSVKLN